MREYIGNFKISMNNVLGSEVLQSFVDIGNRIVYFPLFQLLFFLDSALEISFVTEFGDNVAVSITGEDFKAAQHIRMIQLFKYLYLREEKLL